jgi:hypothetical protein
LARGLEESVRPRQVGFVSDFIKFKRDESEARWQKVERALPSAIESLEQKRLGKRRDHVEVLKDGIALHWARSHPLKVIHDGLMPKVFDQSRARMVADGVPSSVRQRIITRMTEEFAKGEFFHDQVHANFERARTELAPMQLDVVEAIEGEFLIGDCPALPISSTLPGAGPHRGVAWGQADTVILPIGPRFVVGATSHEPKHFRARRGEVEALNLKQLLAAVNEVYFRPGSGLGAFVKAHLPERQELIDQLPRS